MRKPFSYEDYNGKISLIACGELRTSAGLIKCLAIGIAIYHNRPGMPAIPSLP